MINTDKILKYSIDMNVQCNICETIKDNFNLERKPILIFACTYKRC